jgi:predicted aspartyl protease
VKRLAGLVIAASLAGAPGAHAAECGLTVAAVIPLADHLGFLSIPVSIGPHPMSMLIDTGSDAGLLSSLMASDNEITTAHPASVTGTGGVRHEIPVAIVPDVAIGALLLGRVAFPIGSLPALPRITPPVEGLIGGDLLSHFEVEIDVASGVLRLYAARDLTSLCRDLPPWTGSFDALPLERSGNRMTLHVTLDGHPVTALLDSGARSRIVSRDAALAAGVEARTLDAEPGGLTSGIGGHETIYHWHRFRTLAIGTETEYAPVLTVTALPDGPGLLLGSDWFERHRVWISYATSRLFVQRTQR